MAEHDRYRSPLSGRYASSEMQEIWSQQRKVGTWRRLWLALAQSEQELGLSISDEQISQLQEHLDDIDFKAAAKYEEELRHDVMAHVHVLGDAAPLARPIAIIKNKNTNSSGSLIAALNLTIESAPTKPKERAKENLMAYQNYQNKLTETLVQLGKI